MVWTDKGIGDGGPRRTLVIGDVHSHLLRLEGLLAQEGLIELDDQGQYQRVNPNVEIVLLGDVGHFGGTPRADIATWEFAERVADIILWGNHDLAVVNPAHQFAGYQSDPSFVHSIIPLWRRMLDQGRLKLAHSSHGFLLTHAGLTLAIKQTPGLPDGILDHPWRFADWINQASDWDQDWRTSREDNEDKIAQIGVRDSVGRSRGGRSQNGGLLWRDIDESLFTPTPDREEGFRQVFGHSADHKRHQIRKVNRKNNTRDLNSDFPSWCIDIGGRDEFGPDDCLAGLWLPEERPVIWRRDA